MTNKGHGLLTIATWILTFVIFTPVLLLIVTAFKTEVEAVQSPRACCSNPRSTTSSAPSTAAGTRSSSGTRW